MKNFLAVALILIASLPFEGCQLAGQKRTTVDSLHGEVIYHVFERSFYDSNGDNNGDLKGIQEKLDYLQRLGVTSLLLTPIVQSVFYHNYFADNFKKIDPSYGTLQDWISLVKAVHQRGMKIYLDQEFQYVTLKQKWFRDSYKNPRSKYSKYILYQDTANALPEPIIYNISDLKGYNDSTRKVATVNLYNPDVQQYFFNLLKYWMDPNGDGHFDDGVDGFRLDHMMDDLDNKGVLTHLFSRFWCPLLTKLKSVNPKIKLLAEQANWADYGKEYFEKGCVNRVFAFNLRNAIATFNKSRIAAIADSTFKSTPAGDEPIVFIENHDVERFASLVDQDPGKMKVGAALNLLIGGIPSIYYGQELGMFGKGGFARFGNTDGNDIPQREAFEWYKSDSGNGMAIWYKNTGPWWDSTNLQPNDGVSLEEEKDNPGSLWNYYRNLIHLYRTHEALSEGKFAALGNNNDEVFSFIRYTGQDAAIVTINLSENQQPVAIGLNNAYFPWHANDKLVNAFGKSTFQLKNDSISLVLPGYSTMVWEVASP